MEEEYQQRKMYEEEMRMRENNENDFDGDGNDEVVDVADYDIVSEEPLSESEKEEIND